MTVFAEELRARIGEVETELHQDSDDHTVSVLADRLENLLRIAGQHGIEVA
ncbi:hypothetical protein [Nonomuraea sp. B19D2]|uniref:hypothetical protein n=1 Tax=Nonomuraea sp. B19D2 TaxID=3159561 RepID=UPI0032DA1D0D